MVTMTDADAGCGVAAARYCKEQVVLPVDQYNCT
jgi:hypothetical protein